MISRLNMFAMPVFMAFLSLGLMVAQPLMAETALPLTSADTISGDTLKLNDGRNLRLQGIAAPFAATKSLADAAQQKLQSLTTQQTLTIDNPSTDRYGRVTGQVLRHETRRNYG